MDVTDARTSWDIIGRQGICLKNRAVVQLRVAQRYCSRIR
jgi:hypothetical protein